MQILGWTLYGSFLSISYKNVCSSYQKFDSPSVVSYVRLIHGFPAKVFTNEMYLSLHDSLVNRVVIVVVTTFLYGRVFHVFSPPLLYHFSSLKCVSDHGYISVQNAALSALPVCFYSRDDPTSTSMFTPDEARFWASETKDMFEKAGCTGMVVNTHGQAVTVSGYVTHCERIKYHDEWAPEHRSLIFESVLNRGLHHSWKLGMRSTYKEQADRIRCEVLSFRHGLA